MHHIFTIKDLKIKYVDGAAELLMQGLRRVSWERIQPRKERLQVRY